MITAISTRERIALAAVHELKQFGHSDFRIERVAEEADISAPMIYRYFESRSGLLNAAVKMWVGDESRRRTAQMHHWYDGVTTGVELADALLGFGSSRSEADDQELRWAMAEALVLSWHEPDGKFEAIAEFRECFLVLEDAFRRVLERESTDPALDARTLAYIFLSTWFGALLTSKPMAGESSDPSMRPLMLAILAVAFEGPALDRREVPLTERSAPRPNPGRTPAAKLQVRDQLLVSAADALIESGPSEFSVKVVAAKAAKTGSVISRYFDGRTGLMTAAGVKLLGDSYRRRREYLGAQVHMATSIDDVVETMSSSNGEGDDSRVIEMRKDVFTGLVAARHSKVAMEMIEEMLTQNFKLGAASIEVYQDKGLLTVDADASTVSDFMFRLAYGKVFFGSDPQMAISFEHYRTVIEILFRRVLAP